ncbi:protein DETOXIFICATION 27-like isoform X2 [Amaranthus tricolor]|uniref:protein DETOXIFICATION 27-like isoform X2 n=1 Tax=Amaranthus tricolor TaxID=29722 RepID=UPI00258D534E|nr:protein DETOXIFICATION 27-like isoform X2 [Amaranthus tricolor]
MRKPPKMGDDLQHSLLLHLNPNNTIVHSGDDLEAKINLIGTQKTWEEFKKVWRIAGPSIFCRVAMFSLTIITQSLAGHLSDLDLAAFSIATTLLISISFGFLILGQSAEVAERTGLVARWLIPMHLSFVFQFSLQRFLQSQLKMAIIAWSSAVALAVHAVISWFFVYKLGVGIVGTALTLDFSWWFSVFILCGYIFYGGCPLTWNGLSSKAFTELWDFFKLALASGVMVLLENVYYRFLVIASGGAGSSHVAVDALSICVTLFGWESMVPLGILAATGVRVAIELGAGNVNNAKFAAKVCMLTSLVIGLIFFSLVVAIPDRLAMIFTPNLSVISGVHELAVLLGSTILLNSVPPVILGIAVGSGWQVLAAYINIGSYYLVGVPLGIFIGLVLKFGYMGIWVGMLGGSLTQIMLLAAVASKLEWEKEVLKARGKQFMMNKALDD